MGIYEFVFPNIVYKYINVALLCVEEYPHDRPHTTEINPCRLLTDETISDNGLTISTEEMISGPGFDDIRAWILWSMTRY